MMKLNSLHDLFEHELKDTYDAEKMILEAMPMMIEAASNQELKDKFHQHMMQTRGQVERLEEVFDMLDMEPEAEKCDGMKGILKDGEKAIKAEGNPNVKDAALIGAAQKVEHYEISAYGTLHTFAQHLGYHDIAEKLRITLREESRTDEMLTSVAEKSVNPKSM